MSGDIVGAVAQSAQGGVQSVVRHRLGRRPHRGEDVFGVTGDRLERLQDGSGLPRQRHPVRATHFHLLGWDDPKTGVEIEFGPFRMPQFAGAHEGERKQLQARACRQMPVIAVDGAQQRTDRFRFDDGGPMLGFGCDQGAAKVLGRIAFGAARRNR